MVVWEAVRLGHQPLTRESEPALLPEIISGEERRPDPIERRKSSPRGCRILCSWEGDRVSLVTCTSYNPVALFTVLPLVLADSSKYYYYFIRSKLIGPLKTVGWRRTCLRGPSMTCCGVCGPTGCPASWCTWNGMKSSGWLSCGRDSFGFTQITQLQPLANFSLPLYHTHIQLPCKSHVTKPTWKTRSTPKLSAQLHNLTRIYQLTHVTQLTQDTQRNALPQLVQTTNIRRSLKSCVLIRGHSNLPTCKTRGALWTNAVHLAHSTRFMPTADPYHKHIQLTQIMCASSLGDLVGEVGQSTRRSLNVDAGKWRVDRSGMQWGYHVWRVEGQPFLSANSTIPARTVCSVHSTLSSPTSHSQTELCFFLFFV